jgi:putative endonuclease
MEKKYKRMLEGMKKNEGKTKKSRKEKWVLYIIRCGDLSLYTGITKDLDRRFKMHSEGKGARYTRSRLPLEIVYHEICKTRTDALVRECAVKALPKARKLELVGKFEKKLKKKSQSLFQKSIVI